MTGAGVMQAVSLVKNNTGASHTKNIPGTDYFTEVYPPKDKNTTEI